MIIVFFWGAWFQKFFFCIYNLFTKAFHWERDDKDMNFRHRQKQHIRPQRYMRVRNQDKVWRQHRTTHTSPKPLLPCVSPHKSQHTKAPHSPHIVKLLVSEYDNVPGRVATKFADIKLNRPGRLTPPVYPTPEKIIKLFPTLHSLPFQIPWITPQYSPASTTTV